MCSFFRAGGPRQEANPDAAHSMYCADKAGARGGVFMAQNSCGRIMTVQCADRRGTVFKKPRAFRVCVRDARGELLFQGSTGKNGTVRFPAAPGAEYQISVYAPRGLSPGAAHRWVRLPRQCRQVTFLFCPETLLLPARRCIFLSDAYYSGLPISKGEIRLWQVPIQ